jgi:hypothetical protein
VFFGNSLPLISQTPADLTNLISIYVLLNEVLMTAAFSTAHFGPLLPIGHIRVFVSCTLKKECAFEEGGCAFEEGGTSDLVLSSVAVLFGGTITGRKVACAVWRQISPCPDSALRRRGSDLALLNPE